MGFKDTLKAKLAPAKGKVSDLAQQHGGKIEHSLDKAAKAVDSRTKGKYSGKIESGTGKAKGALGRIAHKDTDVRQDGAAPKDEGTTPQDGGTAPPAA